MGIVVVVSTHGFVKKTGKVPEKEIDKAIAIQKNISRIKKSLKSKK